MRGRHLILRSLGTLVAVLALGQASPARAGTMYNFNYTVVTDNGGGSNYSGVIDVQGSTVIAITGTASAYGAISGLLPVNGYGINDNQFFPDSPYVTYYGISFSVDGHGYSNLYDDLHFGWSEYNNSADVNGIRNSSGILTVSQIPELSSAGILATGLAALSLTGVFRLRKPAAGHA